MSLAPRERYARVAASLALLLLVIGGCVDEAAGDGAGGLGTIQGQVTADGEPLAGVTVVLSGAESAVTTTGANGRFSFREVPAGTAVVTLSNVPPEVTFDATSRAVTVPFDDVTDADFRGTWVRGTVRGTITLDGAPLSGVVVTIKPERTAATTDAQGSYTFQGVVSGEHTVVISPIFDVRCEPDRQVVTVPAGGEVTADVACTTYDGARLPTAAEIGGLDVGLDAEKQSDDCPEGMFENALEGEGPFEVRHEDRNGTSYVLVEMNAVVEGPYDAGTGEWTGTGDLVSGDGSQRIHNRIDGTWHLRQDGSIWFEGGMSLDLFDTNGTPDDHGDDVAVCGATYRTTMNQVE